MQGDPLPYWRRGCGAPRHRRARQLYDQSTCCTVGRARDACAWGGCYDACGRLRHRLVLLLAGSARDACSGGEYHAAPPARSRHVPALPLVGNTVPLLVGSARATCCMGGCYGALQARLRYRLVLLLAGSARDACSWGEYHAAPPARSRHVPALPRTLSACRHYGCVV